MDPKVSRDPKKDKPPSKALTMPTQLFEMFSVEHVWLPPEKAITHRLFALIGLKRPIPNETQDT